jgi:hypothetical protein
MEEQANHQPKPRVRKSGCGCGGGRKRQVLTEPKEASPAELTEVSDANIQPAEAVSDQTTEASRQDPMQTVTKFLAQITKSRPRTKRKHK